jgi:hypothetical protein
MDQILTGKPLNWKCTHTIWIEKMPDLKQILETPSAHASRKETAS